MEDKKMVDSIDFKKYRYFYDGIIVRFDKESKQYERLYGKGFAPIFPKRDFDERINDGFDELSELSPDNPRDIELLKREFSKVK